MSPSPTLFQKLQAHFNDAAARYPTGKELFGDVLAQCGERLADTDYDNKRRPTSYPLFFKGLCYEVTKIEKTFEEGEEMVKVFWDAEDLIAKHTGPRI